MSGRVGIWLSAFAIGGQARTLELQEQQVDMLILEARQMLDDDDDLRRAIEQFATDYILHKYDPEGLKRIGSALQAAVDAACHQPPDHQRKDIYG